MPANQVPRGAKKPQSKRQSRRAGGTACAPLGSIFHPLGKCSESRCVAAGAGCAEVREAQGSIRQVTDSYRSRRDFIMKKKSRIQNASQIIAQVKREMQEPRLTESVRNGISAQARSGTKEPAARLARA